MNTYNELGHFVRVLAHLCQAGLYIKKVFTVNGVMSYKYIILIKTSLVIHVRGRWTIGLLRAIGKQNYLLNNFETKSSWTLTYYKWTLKSLNFLDLKFGVNSFART